VRDPERGPRRAAGAKPPPEPSGAAKPKKPGPAEVLAALKTEVEQRGKGQQPSGGADAKDAGEAAAPAANGIARPQGNSKQPAASAKPAKPGIAHTLNTVGSLAVHLLRHLLDKQVTSG
jgi:hypothetical protein